MAKKPAKKYNAAGMDQRGMIDLIRDEEYKRLGLKGYPWDKKIKEQMGNACHGAKTLADCVAVIGEIADKVTPRAA